MEYRPPTTGFRSPEIRPGANVRSDNGWTGVVQQLVPAGRESEGGVSVAWNGDGVTFVPGSMLAFENNEWIIRTQAASQPQTQPQPQPQPRPMQPQDDRTRMAPPPRTDDAATQLAASQPAPNLRNAGMGSPQEPPRPNPYQSAPPLVQEPYRVAETEREVTVPIIEEQVEVRSEWRDAGMVTMHPVTEEVTETVQQPLEHEELVVEHVAVGRLLNEGETVEARQEGDTYIMPIIEEEAVVVVRRFLKEEVRVTKTMVREMKAVEVTRRTQRVEIDGGDHDDRIKGREIE